MPRNRDAKHLGQETVDNVVPHHEHLTLSKAASAPQFGHFSERD